MSPMQQPGMGGFPPPPEMGNVQFPQEMDAPRNMNNSFDSTLERGGSPMNFLQNEGNCFGLHL